MVWLVWLVVACGTVAEPVGQGPEASEAPVAALPPPSPTGDDLVVVRQDGLYGYALADGRLAVPHRFLRAETFREGTAPVCVPTNDPAVTEELKTADPDEACFWGFVGPTGDLVLPPRWFGARGFTGDRAAVAVSRVAATGDRFVAWQLVDPTGAPVTEPIYASLGDVTDGLCTFQVARQVDPTTPAGFMDPSGAVVLQVPGVTQVLTFGDGLAPMYSDGKWGFADRAGTWVHPPTWTMVTSFTSGVAAVKRDPEGTWRYIRPDGTQAFPGEFTAIGVFDAGVAVVRTLDGRTLRIDPTGAIVD